MQLNEMSFNTWRWTCGMDFSASGKSTALYSVNKNRIHIHWTCYVILLFSLFLNYELFCLLIAGVGVTGAHSDNKEHTHTLDYYSSGRGIGPSQRSLPDDTQHSQQTDIHAHNGIRTRSPSKWTAADRPPALALNNTCRHNRGWWNFLVRESFLVIELEF